MHPPRRVDAFFLCSFSAEIRLGNGSEGDLPESFILPGAFAVFAWDSA